MKYRLIAMDLDGTLNNDRKAIDPPTRQALLNVQDKGVRLALASARPLPGLYKERDILNLTDHHGILIACNGGAIVDATDGAVLSSDTMDMEAARRVLRSLERLPVTPIIDDGQRFYVTDRDGYKVQFECMNNRMTCVELPNLADRLTWAPCKILMSMEPARLRDLQQQIAAFLDDDLTVVQTAPFYLEVLPRRINKGDALRAACRAVGIDPAEAMAFGDSENDIPMLQAAGLGVAMANANDDVKAAADVVTLSNNDNGIAAALEKYL